jgi:DNA-binding IclR family transcriptional regulator
MSRANRLLAILDLFDAARPVWTVEEIGTTLGIPTSTIYRHVRDLVQAGFLDPVTGAGYSLGPAFIRYDRLLRQTDPLIGLAAPIMGQLLERTTQHATVILCRRFRDGVMCVHEVHGREPHPPTSYERGVAMPLFLGATSKVILANLPDRTLKRVYQANQPLIHGALGVGDWLQFKAQLREIRRAGYAVTDSEVSKGRIGIAAPIRRSDQLVAGISLVGVPGQAEKERIPEYIPHLLTAASTISTGLSSQSAPISR